MIPRAKADRRANSTLFSCWRVASLFSLLGFQLCCGQLQAASLIPAGPPVAFFTNIASRLLRSELNLDLNQIQVYPTNQYTPAVHRLLQVAANLYDATTNRCFAGACSAPYCPTVFRPLFRRLDTPAGPEIFIIGYREVESTELADSLTAPPMVYLEDGVDSALEIPPIGTPEFPAERAEPLVGGIPVVIGARQGFPNFNEFAMQTGILVSRLLEFRRTTFDGPVTLTNQMYTLTLSNMFGVEAWNSYSNAYPRNLQILTAVDILPKITGIDEAGQGHVILSNRWSLGFSTNLTAGTWPGWITLSRTSPSFVLPFGAGSTHVVTNASYQDSPPLLLPLTHEFLQRSGFYVPRWWLNLNVRLRFVIIDTDTQRIVDYVNLDHSEPTLDIAAKLAEGADCTGNPGSLVEPANQWCTNRVGDSVDPLAPTLGILNQIAIGLGLGNFAPINFALDPYAGTDWQAAVDSFRYNLMSWPPVFPQDQGKIFYRSNVFYAPLTHYRPIYIHTSLEANDPLVHFTADDLGATPLPSELSHVTFVSNNPPLGNLGFINDRYEPWGGNPYISRPLSGMLPFELGAKDALVMRSDDWDFPTNQLLDVAWLGRVHRGTPWQTIFLKSTNVLAETGSGQDLDHWQKWTGNARLHPDWNGGDSLVADAMWTAPTNDWRLVSRLAPLLNTNRVASLFSVNQSSAQGWAELLDGLLVQTNSAPGELESLVLTSNSPLAEAVSAGLDATRLARPGGVFLGVGDILATPQLSVAALWLNPANGAVSDAASEILASELLERLRPDSVGVATTVTNAVFSGFDEFQYALERSGDLRNWSVIWTGYPSNGVVNLPVQNTSASQTFFRSLLLPGP